MKLSNTSKSLWYWFLERLCRRVRKEDSVEDRGEGATHDAVHDPIPFGVDHGGGVGLSQARGHVTDLILEENDKSFWNFV